MNDVTPRKQQALLRYCASLLIAAYAVLALCSCEREQTTILYGTVTDEHDNPVDSILILVQGVQFTNYTKLGQVMTDKNGEYLLTITSKRFNVVNVGIPYWPAENPKFQAHYKWYNVKKNDVATNECCFADTDEKTKYDFELVAK